MTDEERDEATKRWDPRTPLERLESLPKDEQTAFLALFAGARSLLQGSWRADTGTAFKPSFGKAECEWVSPDLWRYRLPGLRLANYEEGPRRVALGMSPGSVVWDVHIHVTDEGREAREAYWAKWRNS